MVADQDTTSPVSPAKRRARQLRTAAVLVLLLGALGVGSVYWLGARSEDMRDDLRMAEYYKSGAAQVEKLYGKEGILVEEWSEDLKQPDTQACLIIVVAALVAGCCFYLAGLMDRDDGGKRGDETGAPKV